MKKQGSKKSKLVMNIYDTQYEIFKDVAQECAFKVTTEGDDNNYDLYWTDQAVQQTQLTKMKPYQKINHWPGMYNLSRKNNLGINLMELRKKFPEYNFFPKTYILPSDSNLLMNQFNERKFNKTFIVKPVASSQGQGIFLVRKPREIPKNEQFVVQRYISKPYLIDGLKFDLRIYVLLAGIDPLRIYMFKEGMARFATEPYQMPQQNNLQNFFQHLTNYSINKDSSKFIQNKSTDEDGVGHKRSLTSIWEHFRSQGVNVDELIKKIQQIFVMTIATSIPKLKHQYKSCQPDDYKNQMCFEILGMDVILDHKLRPYLLEINHTPSFSTDSPFDYKLKFNLICDTIKLLNFNENDKINYLIKQVIYQSKKEKFQDLQINKKVRITPEEREKIFQQGQQERDSWELNHLGNFEDIRNAIPQEQLQKYISHAQLLYDEQTGGNKRIKDVLFQTLNQSYLIQPKENKFSQNQSQIDIQDEKSIEKKTSEETIIDQGIQNKFLEPYMNMEQSPLSLENQGYLSKNQLDMFRLRSMANITSLDNSYPYLLNSRQINIQNNIMTHDQINLPQSQQKYFLPLINKQQQQQKRNSFQTNKVQLTLFKNNPREKIQPIKQLNNSLQGLLNCFQYQYSKNE